VSFADPTWLLVLLAIPVALAVHRLSQRRARRYAIRFPALATLQAAAAGAVSWYRHVPLALLLAGTGALALALARPHVTEQVAIQQASIMLVTDESGSMASTDVSPTRLGAAEQAADAFISRLPGSARVGAVAFASAVEASQAPVTDHSAARAVIDSQQAGGGTATGDALALALQLLNGASAKHPPSAIVLLSDGAANEGVSPLTIAAQAKRERIPIDTVALGTPNGVLQTGDPLQPSIPVPPDPALMRAIAQTSGGTAFNARTADELSSIYTKLSRQLGTRARKRDVTALFAAGGLVFILFAGAGSARLTGRLP
jgi:Ca-activated chloride channel family protein